MAEDNFILAKLAIVSLTGCPQARRTAKALARGARRVPGVNVRIIANSNGPSRLRYAMSRYSRQPCSATVNQAPPVTTQQSLTSADAVLFGLSAPDDTIAGRVRAFSELLGALWHEDALDAQLTGAYFVDDKTPVHYSDDNTSDDAFSTKSSTTATAIATSDTTNDDGSNCRKNSTASSTGSLSQSSSLTPTSPSNNNNNNNGDDVDDGAFTLLTYWSKQHQALNDGLLNSAPISRTSSVQSRPRSRSRPHSFPESNQLTVPSASAMTTDEQKRNSISSDSDYTLASSNTTHAGSSNSKSSLEQVIEDRAEQFARQLVQLKMASVNSAVRRRFNTINGNFMYPSGSRSASVSRHASTGSALAATRPHSAQVMTAPRLPISTMENTSFDNNNNSHQHHYDDKSMAQHQSSKLSPTTTSVVRLSNEDTQRLLPRSIDWDENNTTITLSDSCLATSNKRHWRGIRKVFRSLARSTMG
ncbi:hypothetical protein BDF22DRAFT_469761 [Syncephalis plumigaleata]|nr:hypothetical protein BDF22DRAFT_469761 [Syncephalis plumigaleata]